MVDIGVRICSVLMYITNKHGNRVRILKRIAPHKTFMIIKNFLHLSTLPSDSHRVMVKDRLAYRNGWKKETRQEIPKVIREGRKASRIGRKHGLERFCTPVTRLFDGSQKVLRP